MKKRLTIKKEVKDIIWSSLCIYDDNYMKKDPHPPSFSVYYGAITYITHTGSGKYVITDTSITFEGLPASFRDGTPFWNNKLLELLSGGVWEDDDGNVLSAENSARCDIILDYVENNPLVNVLPIINDWGEKTKYLAERYSCSAESKAGFKIDISEFSGERCIDIHNYNEKIPNGAVLFLPLGIDDLYFRNTRGGMERPKSLPKPMAEKLENAIKSILKKLGL